ncbi:MAG: hypothetical protein AAFZ18_16755 [Myxococcota bacterium]
MENTIRWVGIDAHTDSLNVAVLEGFASRATEWKIEHTTASVKRLTKKLVQDGTFEVRACYEAGPTGYELQRALAEAGIACRVPSALSPRPEKAGTKLSMLVGIAHASEARGRTACRVPAAQCFTAAKRAEALEREM